MPKIRKVHKSKKYQFDVNRKKLKKKNTNTGKINL